MTIIDNAVYVNGVRSVTPPSLEQSFEALSRHGGMAWIGLYRPSESEMAAVADEFQLHQLAVEDAIQAHQRPKLERYDSTLFTVLRPARYLDDSETVEFGELHVFTGKNFVVTIRQAETAGVAQVRRRLESQPTLMACGPEAVLYALLDQVVDDYAPVVAGLENDIDEIEDQLFSGDTTVSRRIYELAREVIQFQRAINPLPDMISLLRGGFSKYGVDIELQRNLRDVEDHVEHLISKVQGFRELLQNALTLDGTLTANRQNEASAAQNEQVKKISSWAAILFAPSFVAGIYGMHAGTALARGLPAGGPHDVRGGPAHVRDLQAEGLAVTTAGHQDSPREGFKRGRIITPGTKRQLGAFGLFPPPPPERRVLIPTTEPLPVKAAGDVLWVGFAELCGGLMSTADYRALAAEYRVWVVDGVPSPGHESADGSAGAWQRFSNAVDVLYDEDVTLFLVGHGPLDWDTGGAHGTALPVDMARIASRLSLLERVVAASGTPDDEASGFEETRGS